ncbi:MAG: DUF3108 domain-containing protein [Planctomycetota bacterium]
MNTSAIRDILAAAVLAAAVCQSGCVLPEPKAWTPAEAQIEANRRQLMVAGEKLSYTIRSGIFILGQAQLVIKASEKNPENLDLVLLANSTHPWLPSLSYSYRSTVAPDDLATLAFEMEETEKSEIKKSVTFLPDYTTQTAEYTRTRRRATTRSTLAFEGRVHDYISLLYLLRKDLPAVGDQRRMTVFNEDALVDVSVKNLASRELVLAGVGKFKAFILKPKRALEGIFFSRRDILVWIDETYHIPIRIVIKLPFRTATIDLVKAENTQTGKTLFQ